MRGKIALLAFESGLTSQISVELGSPVVTGSFGDVYRSTIESNTGKIEIAVKVFRIDPMRTMVKLRKAMLRELIVWLRLKHPNIVPLLGIARVESPLLALVSRWMPSGTLYKCLIEEQAITITPSARVGLVEGIAKGLDYLHSENVIHGDLHPGNILIDGSGNPCLTDFGLATVAGDPELQWTSVTMACSLHSRWHAPEVIGIDGDPRRPTFKSDIYSFGSVMFFVVSGSIPWEGKNSSHISIQLSKRATPTRPHDVSDHHWNLIQECWSWEPGDRPYATRILQAAEYPQETSMSYDASRTAPLPRRTGTQETISSQVTISSDFVTEICASMLAKNIVLFGEAGAGKSSVVNLIAGEELAETSHGTECCTQHWEEHSVTFDGYTYRVFDTVGLNDPNCGRKEYLNATVDAYHLISKLRNEGGIDLLLFCVRAGSITPAFHRNYRFFYEWLCAKQVPVVIILTGLERERRMDDWWDRNNHLFRQWDIHVAGHACITAANRLDGRHRQLYEESCRLVRELVIKHTDGREGGAYRESGDWYGGIVHLLGWLLLDNPTLKSKDIVSVLTERCGMSQQTAMKIAKQVRKNSR